MLLEWCSQDNDFSSVDFESGHVQPTLNSFWEVLKIDSPILV